MKYICSILLCLILSNPVLSQKESLNKKPYHVRLAYVNVNVGPIDDNYMNGAVGFNFIFNNNWGGSFDFLSYMKKASDLPSNFSLGLMQGTPSDKLKTISFRVNREIRTKSKQIRLGIETGFSIVTYQKLFFYPNTSSGWFGSNYIQSEFTYQSLGLSAKAKLAFLLSRRFGVEFAAIANINQYQNVFGGQIGIMLGKVNEKF